MHIAMWSPGWPLKSAQNGIVTFVDCMARELTSLGHRVSVFAPSSPHSKPMPGVQWVGRAPGDWRDRVLRRLRTRQDPMVAGGQGIAAALLAVHRRDPIDVIEMEESFGWAGDVERVTGLPMLVKLHGPAFLSLTEEELQSPGAAAKIDREGRALGLANAIAAPSRSTLSDTLARYGLTPKIGEHVVNPVTVDTLTPLWDAGKCDPDTILFVGRFDRRKGADLLLDAFERLARERPRLKLVFAGPDRGMAMPSGAPLDFAAYCAQTLSAETSKRIDYRGSLSNSDVALLRVGAALTVVASRWESQGYTALEAMLQGCPLVSSDAGGLVENGVHGQTGLFFRSGDAGDLGEKIATLLDDRATAATLGAAGRRYVLEHHAARKVAEQSLDLYRRVIESAKR